MDVSNIASEFGKMGGKANVKKNGKDHMKAISKLGVEARKKKKESSKLLLDK